MADFSKVDVNPNWDRLRKTFVKQMRDNIQEYIDELNGGPDEPIEGMTYKVTPNQAKELLDDILLYCNGGEALDQEIEL